MNKKLMFALIFLFLMSSLVVNVSAQKTPGRQQVTGHLRELADSVQCLLKGDMDCFIENLVAAIPLIAGFLIIFTVIFFFGRNAVFKGDNGQTPAIAFGIGVALLALWQGAAMGVIAVVSGPLLTLIFVMIVIIGIMWTLKMRRDSGFAITPDEVKEKTERKKAKQEGKRSTKIEKKETELEEKLLSRERKGFNKLLKLTEKDLKNIEKVHKYLEELKKNIGYLYQIRDEPKSVQLKEQVLKQIQSIIPYATKEMAAENERKRVLDLIKHLKHKEFEKALKKGNQAGVAAQIRRKTNILGFKKRSSKNTAAATNLAKKLIKTEKLKKTYNTRLVAMENDIKAKITEIEGRLTSLKDNLYNNNFPDAERDIDEALKLNREYWTLEDDIKKIEEWMKDVEKYEFAVLKKDSKILKHPDHTFE